MIKVPSCRFLKCLGSFDMLTVDGCFETALFGEVPDQVFDSLQFRKYISYDDLFFQKNF